MVDIPILFSAPMIRALLEGRKTQTRRLADKNGKPSRWLKAKQGDRLWVREAWKPHSTFDHLSPREIPKTNIFYLADRRYSPSGSRGRPSIHMPRWASRLTLTLTEVRVESLQDISAGDAVNEGVSIANRLPCGSMDRDPVEDFCELWGSINGAASWDANPEVVVLSFTVALRNIDAEAA